MSRRAFMNGIQHWQWAVWLHRRWLRR
jgi:hypothetical protein